MIGTRSPSTPVYRPAGLLFGRGQRATAANALFSVAAGWNGCCAQGGEAIVGSSPWRFGRLRGWMPHDHWN
jgi:hypothetical protein